jgi:hypothetical protein
VTAARASPSPIDGSPIFRSGQKLSGGAWVWAGISPGSSMTAPNAQPSDVQADSNHSSGFPPLDQEVTVTLGGQTVTTTQEMLERAANRSNSVWRLRAEKQIEQLETIVSKLAEQVLALTGAMERAEANHARETARAEAAAMNGDPEATETT